jgi:hypothetical protein
MGGVQQIISGYANTTSGLPTGGGTPGIRLVNVNNTTPALIGISFAGNDSTDVERNGATILMGRESVWTGGSGNYPSYLTIWTRPTGGNPVERLRISSTGLATFTNNVVSLDYFATTNGNAVFGPTGSGNVLLRPQGPANATGQMLLTNGGELRIPGDYVATSLIANLAATGAGQVNLRPNGIAVATQQFSVLTSGRAEATHTIRSLGQADPTAGIGVEINWSGTAGTVIAVNRAGGAFQPIQVIGSNVDLRVTAGVRLSVNATGLGFFAAAPVAQQNITGSRAANAALASLLTALALMGLITNGTTA